jgi:hypothetical protein
MLNGSFVGKNGGCDMKRSLKKNEPMLMLHGRIMFRNNHGEVSDVTHAKVFGLKNFADAGATAIHILNQLRKRLDLLFMAAEHRSHVDSSLVRLVVEDINLDLMDGGDLAGYVHLTQEMFERSEALPPVSIPDSWDVSQSLSLAKPAS